MNANELIDGEELLKFKESIDEKLSLEETKEFFVVVPLENGVWVSHANLRARTLATISEHVNNLLDKLLGEKD